MINSKIKTIHSIEFYDEKITYHEIKESYDRLKEKLNTELEKSGLQNDFEIEIVVNRGGIIINK